MQPRAVGWFSSGMTNLNSPPFEDRGVDGFRVRRARLAQAAGAKRIGMSLWELPPGEAAYPYHWLVVDEEVIVALDDGLSLRGHDGEWRSLPQGEVVALLSGGMAATSSATAVGQPRASCRSRADPPRATTSSSTPTAARSASSPRIAMSCFAAKTPWITGTARARQCDEVAPSAPPSDLEGQLAGTSCRRRDSNPQHADHAS